MNDDTPFINRNNDARLPIIEAENERRALETEIWRQRNRLSRTIVGGVIAVLVLVGWFFRLDLVPDQTGLLYTYNRITGELRFARGHESILVLPVK